MDGDDDAVPAAVTSTRELKVVLLGEAGVGKSSLVYRFVAGHWTPNSASTVGASFLSKTMVVDGTALKFQLWDTAGQEKYRGLAPMYYRGAAAAIIVYDITKPHSFDIVKEWRAELIDFGPPGIVIAIAGNKADLEDEREVPTSQGEEYAASIGALFIETSAKTAQNVTELFRDLSQRIPADAATTSQDGSTIEIIDYNEGKEKKKCCK